MAQPYKLIDPSTLTEDQVANSVRYLQSAFAAACYAYRAKSVKKVVYGLLRDPKTLQPIIEADADLTLYNVQTEFSYILNDIMRGPVFLAANEIKKCNDLIDSIA